MKVEYSVLNNEVTILDMYDVDKTYIKKVQASMICPFCDPNCTQCQECAMKDNMNMEEDMMAECKKNETKMAELETEIASLKEQLVTKDTEIATKDTEITEVNSKLTIVAESIIAKDAELAEILPIKLAHEAMLAEKATTELAEKKTALKEKFSKLFSVEVLAEVEIAEALENLDIAKLNAKVVEIAMSTVIVPVVMPVVESGSRIIDDIKLTNSDLVSKYITLNN